MKRIRCIAEDLRASLSEGGIEAMAATHEDALRNNLTYRVLFRLLSLLYPAGPLLDLLKGLDRCVGESGFWAEDECMAIAWIYARRARLVGWPLLKMIRRYSAATKPHEVHRRPWIFELDAKAEKPKHWPKTIRWQRHRKAWLNLLARLDRWKDGHEPDPMPEADHYGSYRDANQSRYVRTWKRVEAPAGFKNLYFNSSVRYARAVDKYTRWMVNK